MASPRVDYYYEQEKLYVATDCVIFGFDGESLKLLVFKRRVEPLKGEWSLIGSFVNLDEDVSLAAQRVLREITGLKDVYMQELRSYGAANRDPGYRCISIAHYALIRLSDYDRELVEKHGAHWYSLDELPKLVLDHNKMLQDALHRLRKNARYQPIGFELLPEKFTIPQLQKLYEVIYQNDLDSRNFRKKLLSLNLLIKLDEKDKSTSRRGAFLYKFDHKKYREVAEKGYDFQIS